MTAWSCISRNNRKARGIKQFLLKHVFLVCTQLESARGGLLPLSASGKSSHLLFPLSGEGKPSTGPWHQHAVHCPGLPSTHHGLGEELTQAANPVLLLPGHQHPLAGGGTSQKGQPGTVPQVPVVMTK